MAGCRDLDEPEPSEINTKNHPHLVDVKKDKLTAVYIGKGNHTDYGSVQANVPIPVNRSVYYFEVIILDPGARGTITIGLTDRSFLLNRQPGYEANSYGYRAEDGKKFLGSNRGEPYGPAFGKNDTVGCGIDFIKGLVFFTRNGVNLGTAGQLGLAMEYFPTLAMHSPNEKAQFRFAPPYAFNPAEIALQNLREERGSIFLEKIPRDIMMKLARSYIVSSGFVKTLEKFDASSGIPADQIPQDDKTQLLEKSSEWRQEIRRSIIDGQILIAIESIQTHCPALLERPNSVLRRTPTGIDQTIQCKNAPDPHVFKNTPDLHVFKNTPDRQTSQEHTGARSRSQEVGRKNVAQESRSQEFRNTPPREVATQGGGLECWSSFRSKAVAMLYSQHFVELLRNNCNGEALKWLREKLSPLRQDASQEVTDILRDSCVLLAYGANKSKNNLDVGTDDMMHHSRRVLCAELANAACVKLMLGVDERNPQDAWSPLQFALRHTVILRQAMHVRNVDRGPVVCPRLLCCG